MARRDRPVSQRQAWWLLATALAALLPLTPHLPIWLVAATIGTMLFRGVITWQQRHLPPRWLLMLLVIAGTAAVGAEYRTVFGRVPGVALLAVFLSLKLLELRAARDALTVVLLCYFLVLGQFLFTQTMTTAVLASLTVLVTTASLAAAADDRLAPALLARRAGIMLLQALPFMLLLFILFPRVQGPLWGLPQDKFSAVSGLSDNMAPGSIAQLSQSDAIAFRVRFNGAVPQQTELYWRGPVMPRFDGRSWSVVRTRATPAEVPYTSAGPTVDYEVTLEPHGKFWLFALHMPEALPPESGYTEDLQLISREAVRNRMRYQLRSRVDTLLYPDESRARLRESLALPRDGNPRTRAEAQRWREKAGDDNAAIVELAETFFSNQLLAYTLNPPLLAADPIDGFLFDTKRGFCEHFASAFAFAMRAAGVPARVVAGYQGGELNPVDGYFVVRQYDAHAWTEVWIPAKGWVRVDPTAISAPRRISNNLTAAVPEGESLPFFARTDLAWLREMRDRFDAVANGWNQWILGYTPQRQREFLQGLGFEAPDWRTMTAVLTVLSGIVLLILTAWVLHQRKDIDPGRRAWLRFTRRMAKLGIVWQPWEGPRDYARRAAGRHPALATRIDEIALAYEQLRYGPEPTPRALTKLRQLVAAFRP